MTENRAGEWAKSWLDAWNRHDMEAILSHYAEEVEYESPLVSMLMESTVNEFTGKDRLREYVRRGLALYPDLRFTLLYALAGVNGLVIVYRSVINRIAAEVLTLNAKEQVSRVSVYYCEPLERGDSSP